MENLNEIRKAVVDAKKELTLAKQEKERVLRDVEMLSDEKIKSMDEIKNYKLIGDSYKIKSSEAQKEYADKVLLIDGLNNKIKDLEAKAKHVMDNADLKTSEANKLMDEATSQFNLAKSEQQKLKQERADFDEKLRQNKIKEFDYENAHKKLEEERTDIQRKDILINEERISLSAMRRELESLIEQNKKSISDLEFERKDLVLKKTNYTDAMNNLNERILTYSNKIKDTNKLEVSLKEKIAMAEANVLSTKRNFADLTNKENELKLKQLKFEKLLRDKSMVEELQKYEKDLAS